MNSYDRDIQRNISIIELKNNTFKLNDTVIVLDNEYNNKNAYYHRFVNKIGKIVAINPQDGIITIQFTDGKLLELFSIRVCLYNYNNPNTDNYIIQF